MALAKVAADKRHLLNTQRQPFFIMGVNYVGYFDRAWKMWESNLFDPDLITRDFHKAQQTGFNTIRLFLPKILGKRLIAGDFNDLDHTLSIAQDHNLLVMLTLNDAHSLNLAQVAELDAKIAERYREVPTIFAYDLENEPTYYALAAAIYPDGHPPPIQTSRLIDQYGERVSRSEAIAMQQQHSIPSHLSEDEAFYYINGLRLFLEYDAAVKTFVREGRGTIVDFMISAEASPWYELITVFDETVDMWLRARIDPIREVGCQQLLTLGWNWLQFAVLPSNRRLDFQTYHNYASLTASGFNTNLDHLATLAQAFPDHPILLGEFGWSNQTTTNPASSQPIEPKKTALYEAATFAYLRSHGFAGGMKWVLNDVQDMTNPYEASFGIFKKGDDPKEIRELLHRFSQNWPPVNHLAHFYMDQEVEAGLAYRFDLPQQITTGGHIYQDETISWQGEGIGHCFIKIDDQEIEIEALGNGQLSFAPWILIPTWNRTRKADLYRVYSEQSQTRQHSFEAGESVIIEVHSGAKYKVKMGITTPLISPPDDAPQVEPKAGEHVVLLGDFETYFQTALAYLRRFGPDFSFAPQQVIGRWAYVSVVATPEQIPDSILDDIRAVGTVLVERVIDETPAETKTMLNEMARQGQRFLTAIAPPPQDEPPTDPTTPPPSDGTEEIYIVQPGDTLSKIADKVYQNFRMWPLIFEANRDKISNPSLIRVGMVLHIPDPT